MTSASASGRVASVVATTRSIGARGVFDDGHGRVGVGAVHHQAALHEAGGFLAHVDRGDLARPRHAAPVLFGEARHVMAGDDAQRWRCGPRRVRLWPMDAAATAGGGQAGHDACSRGPRLQRLDLFVQPAEDAAVAALQPHHARARSAAWATIRALIVGLRGGGAEAFLARVDPRAPAGRSAPARPAPTSRSWITTSASASARRGAQRQMVGVARAGADEGDLAGRVAARRWLRASNMRTVRSVEIALNIGHFPSFRPVGPCR